MIREVGSVSRSESSSITLEGSCEEIDAVRAMLAGVQWLRVTDAGALEAVGGFHPLPKPCDDPMIPPKWAIPVPHVGQATAKDIERAENAVKPPMNVAPPIDPAEGWHMPGFYVTHLCGYWFSKENYISQAKILTACGFECMRSRRGKDGKFWEVWCLPFPEQARGALKEVVQKVRAAGGTWQSMTDAVVNWLIRHVGFGALDVTVQRAAMTVD